MNVNILDPAKDDLAEALWFYESQKRGLGNDFLDRIYVEIDKLANIAGIHPMYDPPYYQMFSQIFPYTIYYRLEGQEVFVEAVIDQRRDPYWIADRLS
jgi:hypothetical protein